MEIIIFFVTIMNFGKLAHSVKAKIAVVGSGLSGSYLANILSEAGYNVYNFEIGRGGGGRSSSRRQENYNFDHGYSDLIYLDFSRFIL